MTAISGCLAVMAAVAGCAGPRAAPPQSASVTVPDAWRDRDAGSGQPLAADWWTGFNDPVLSDLIARALAGNSDLAIAAERVVEARAQFRLAHGQLLPQIDASIGGGPSRSVNPFGMGLDQTAGQAQLGISYDLDLFGRLSQSAEAARASALATAAGRDTVRLAIIASTANGYFGLRSLDARLAVLEQTASARRDALHLAARRASTGYSPALDERQAQAELEAAEALIPATQLAIRRQENSLRLLMGELPGTIERGREAVDLAILRPAPSVPSLVLRRRPDIFQAEQTLGAADRSLDAARAAFMPSIRLSASGGGVASTLLPSPITLFNVGGSILAPLFQGGRLRAQADAATSRRDQAAFAYRRAVLTAFRETEDALASVSRTDEQVEKLERQRTSLSSVLILASNRYRAGYSPYLEQLDAQRALLSAELSLVQARSDALTARVLLFQALGGGWNETDAIAAGPPTAAANIASK
ncbi:RND transporter [Sphingobium yanoikuyae]|nr:RND transporter [Sphingobium yanoikuyae]